jgi:hypothetical protein
MESYYSAQEMADMHFTYGCANGNSQEARCFYTEHYPQHRIPSHKWFTTFHQRLSKYGSFASRASDRRRPRSVQTPEMEVHILRKVEEDPGTSVWRIAAAEGISVPLVGRILHHFTHTTFSECKPSLLLTIMRGWWFANAFSQNTLWTHSL